jgi:glucose/arabinose dehydrogenase
MRNTALLLCLAAAACGDDGGNATKGDARPVDTGQLVDSPPLATCTPVNGTTVSVRKVGQIQGSALLATSPPNDGRLFVVEQSGTIRIFENDQLKPQVFLDLSSTNLTSDTPQGERGLLGLAFDPDFGNNGTFYVMYTAATGANAFDIVARYKVSATDLNKADPTSGEIILSIPDFAGNHNGGMLQFGPKDGYLYIGTGDGGSGGDPRRNGQALDRTACAVANCEPLLGKILRIDVHTSAGVKNYGIPPTNPFATSGGEPEIFVIGVRNPWRWTFDSMTGDIWIADVGQDAWEELTVLKHGQIGGKNLGWSRYEGLICYKSLQGVLNYPGCVDAESGAANFTAPQFVKTHSGTGGWKAIIGGQAYRGTCYPDLVGSYFMSDNTAHPLVQAKLEDNGTVTTMDLPAPTAGWPTGPAGIHADARGELYITTTGGGIYHIEAAP